MDIDRIDLSSLRSTWERRQQAAADVRVRTNPDGMTKPARDEDERAFLRRTGGESVFREVPMPGLRAWRAGESPRNRNS